MLRSAIRTFAIAAVASAAASPATAMGGAGAAKSRTVVLHNLSFTPRTVAVSRGGTVTWLWHDGSTAHNVTGAHFHSRTQSRGSFSVHFTRAGSYSYHCTIHRFMTGEVVVR